MGWGVAENWGMYLAVILYYLPFYSAPLFWQEKKQVVDTPKKKRERARTTRRRKGESDADYLARIIERDCPDMNEGEVLIWIKEHRKAKRTTRAKKIE